ncbi:MAG: thiamine pyrophosphate-binding protein [Alphaproteobacteria bacterium]|jgi:sulfopyruvate decarboxylase TPP-binding subunit|nr:thiamine pyrophosphate-binding protein [Alphaproteobacteria bacterium]MDP7221933.1 thiamine pyrophosphate-binding protein [Alphaproteobacteria bacterium]
MTNLIERFVPLCKEADIDLVTSVPDGYLVPFIEQIDQSDITHVRAAREEECFGIASGAAMTGKRALIMVQNAGFLNSIGCFATLCMNYRLPIVILVTHRGNIFDKNRYDTEKFRYYEAFTQNPHVFSVSWHAHKNDGNIIARAFGRAEAAKEPTIVNLDFPPTDTVAC